MRRVTCTFPIPTASAKWRNSAASTTTFTFTINDRGGIRRVTGGGLDATIKTGYARIQPDTGSTVPAGLAIFGFRRNGVLVSEAGVAASPALRSGRIYAEVSSDLAVNTGLAIANPNERVATINFSFTNAAGVDFGAGSTAIPPQGQIAKFLNQSPFDSGAGIQGAFTLYRMFRSLWLRSVDSRTSAANS